METKKLTEKVRSKVKKLVENNISLKTGVLAILIGISGCSGYLPDFKGGHWPSPNPHPAPSAIPTPVKTSSPIPMKEDETSPEVLNESTSSELEGRETHPADVMAHLPANLKGTTTFVVTEPGLSLSLISLILYGTTHEWPEIAKWNQIKAPFYIQLGQRLILNKATSIPKSQFDRRLLEIWRSRLDKRQEAGGKFGTIRTPAQEISKSQENTAREMLHQDLHESEPEIGDETEIHENSAVSYTEANIQEPAKEEITEESGGVSPDEIKTDEIKTDDVKAGEIQTDELKTDEEKTEELKNHKIRAKAPSLSLYRSPSVASLKFNNRVPIHFNDFVRKIKFNKQSRLYEMRFKSKSKTYTVATQNTIYYCLKIALKHMAPVKILANRSTHEIFSCQ